MKYAFGWFAVVFVFALGHSQTFSKAPPESHKSGKFLSVAVGETAKELRCGILLPKREYTIGESVTATVILQNLGSKPLRVVRYHERKFGHRAHFNWTRKTPELPNPLICECEPDIYRGKKAGTLVLYPGEVYGFEMRSDALTDAHNQRPFVSVSYFVREYTSDLPNDAVPAWLSEKKNCTPLWQGMIKSGRVQLKITDRNE